LGMGPRRGDRMLREKTEVPSSRARECPCREDIPTHSRSRKVESVHVLQAALHTGKGHGGEGELDGTEANSTAADVCRASILGREMKLTRKQITGRKNPPVQRYRWYQESKKEKRRSPLFKGKRVFLEPLIYERTWKMTARGDQGVGHVPAVKQVWSSTQERFGLFQQNGEDRGNATGSS